MSINSCNIQTFQDSFAVFIKYTFMHTEYIWNAGFKRYPGGKITSSSMILCICLNLQFCQNDTNTSLLWMYRETHCNNISYIIHNTAGHYTFIYFYALSSKSHNSVQIRDKPCKSYWHGQSFQITLQT